MPRTVGAYEAKTHLPRLLDEVSAGETMVITKHRVTVAQLVPPTGNRPDAAKTVAAWRAYRERENITLGGLSIREMIEEGRLSVIDASVTMAWRYRDETNRYSEAVLDQVRADGWAN